MPADHVINLGSSRPESSPGFCGRDGCGDANGPSIPLPPHTAPGVKCNAISFLRLLAATVFAAVTGAFALALGLHFAAHGSSVQLPTVAQPFGMSAFFSLFTLPVSIAFALPAGWLWRRNGPIHPVKCALLGAVGRCTGWLRIAAVRVCADTGLVVNALVRAGG